MLKKIHRLKNKDYNDELEKVLSKKLYKENVKSLLLDSLYKVETSYKDYSIVKQNVMPKEEYLNNIINVVKNDCNNIIFLKPDGIQTTNYDAYFVDKQNKEICCYPIGRKLLYCISKIQKSDDIIKIDCNILNKALTNLLNIGNNINMVEPLRDFNGFSWNICVDEIENLYYNLVYQDIIILIGNKFLEQWINKNECIIDYVELFKSELEKKYDDQIAKNILDDIKKIAVLLEAKDDESFKKNAKSRKLAVQKTLRKMRNKEKYLEDLSAEKKDIEKKIKEIDLIINDKKLLHDKYAEINKDLPLEKKIFSTRLLAKKMKEEREKYLEQLEQYNNLMNPSQFRKNKLDLEDEYKYLVLSDVDDYDSEIYKNIISLQKEVLRALISKISNADNKEDLTKILYELRYYYFIPVTKEKNIKNLEELSELINIVNSKFFEKSETLNLLTKICNDSKKNEEILKFVFDLKIIKLENIYFKIISKNENLIVQFYDEDTKDENFKINENIRKEDLKIKINKITKLFD